VWFCFDCLGWPIERFGVHPQDDMIALMAAVKSKVKKFYFGSSA